MRQIKFRGKRVDNGEWIEGDLAKYLNGSPSIMPKSFFATRDFGEEEESGLPKLEESMALGGFYSVISETVGQFTGLTDKNGKEIFEGDILKVYGYHRSEGEWTKYFSVVFDDAGFCLKRKNELYSFFKDQYVIGNIHDNKDLIK